MAGCAFRGSNGVLSCTRLASIAGTPCRATRVALHVSQLRCSIGVALHPLNILVSHLPPPGAGKCRTEIWVGKGVALHGGVAATVADCATKMGFPFTQVAHSPVHAQLNENPMCTLNDRFIFATWLAHNYNCKSVGTTCCKFSRHLQQEPTILSSV